LNSANFSADGVLGMGFQSSNWLGPSIVNNLFNQDIITNAVFAFKLVQDESELNIGGLNTDLYSGTPYYTPIMEPGFWYITLTRFMAGSSISLTGANAYMMSVRLEFTTLFSMLIDLNRVPLSPLALQRLCPPYTP